MTPEDELQTIKIFCFLEFYTRINEDFELSFEELLSIYHSNDYDYTCHTMFRWFRESIKLRRYTIPQTLPNCVAKISDIV